MAKCCNTTSKCFIMLINLVIWGVAAGLIFLGTWLFIEFAKYGELIDVSDAHILPACLLVSSGIALFLLGLVGCIGTVKEHKCIMALYFSLMLVVLVGIVGGVAFAFFYHQRIETDLHQTMTDGFEKYNSSNATREIVDLMQSHLHCCGVNNYTDWEKWMPQNGSHITLPHSCYFNNNFNNNSSHNNGSVEVKYYTEGCYVLLRSQIVKYTNAIYGVVGGCVLMILIGLISTCMLIRARRNQGFVYRDLVDDDDGMHV